MLKCCNHINFVFFVQQLCDTYTFFTVLVNYLFLFFFLSFVLLLDSGTVIGFGVFCESGTIILAVLFFDTEE